MGAIALRGKRSQGAADARHRARRRTIVLQVSGNAGDGVPCERLLFLYGRFGGFRQPPEIVAENKNTVDDPVQPEFKGLPETAGQPRYVNTADAASSNVVMPCLIFSAASSFNVMNTPASFAARPIVWDDRFFRIMF